MNEFLSKIPRLESVKHIVIFFLAMMRQYLKNSKNQGVDTFLKRKYLTNSHTDIFVWTLTLVDLLCFIKVYFVFSLQLTDVMNAFLITVMICESLAHYMPNSESPNVGTVLFTSSDLNKKQWSKTNIALLQARQYLQNIIPSPMLIGTVNEDYLTNLISYFENAYTIVKRDITSPSLTNIMDVALSDALGGYLKVFVLPITKYAYYGGTVSLASSLKIFDTYEDIKRSLNTDGRGWRSPNENILNSVAISIMSEPIISTTSMPNACEQFAYYEKTDEGMKIPMPYINWDISPPTMFLPLVNSPIVSLSSPSSSSTLLKYYSVADNCVKSQFDKLDDFYKRFQKWLSTEVAPHLKDDKLYAAFGSILSLSSTKTFCNEKIDKLKSKANSLRNPMTLTSKKFLIIALILILEIVWCIPTIVYIVCLRKRKRKTSTSIKTIETPEQSKNGMKFFVQPKTNNLEVDVQFPSIGSHVKKLAKCSNTFSHSNFSCCNLMTLVSEVPLKSSSTKIVPVMKTTRALNTSPSKESRKIDNALKINCDKVKELKLTKTFSLIHNSEKTINEITYSQKMIDLFDKDNSTHKCNTIQNNQNLTKKSLSLACIKDIQNKENSKVKQKSVKNEPKPKHGKLKSKAIEKKTQGKTVMFCQTEKISEKQKGTMIETEKIGTSSKKDSKHSSHQPELRILIEKPQTSIKVGITCFKGPETTKKPSKIPRAVRVPKESNNPGRITTDSYTPANASKVNDKSTRTRGIVRRRKALDDTAIKQTSIVDKKLNVTL